MGREPADRTVAKATFDGSQTQNGTRRIRDTTRSLVKAVALDVWPSNAAVGDFGIRSQEHYEALYYPLRHGEITPEQVDAALGNGRKLSELVNAAPRNPHKGIEFRTDWDDLRPEPERLPSAAGNDKKNRPGQEERRSSPGELAESNPPPQQQRNHSERRGKRH